MQSVVAVGLVAAVSSWGLEARAQAPPSPDPEPSATQPAEATKEASAPEPVKVVPVQQPDGRVVLVPVDQLMQPQAQPQVVVVTRPRADRPKTLSYVEGDPVPSGYRKEEKAITGLVIAGPIVLGVGWLTSSMAGLIMAADRLGDDNGFLAMTVPVVGGLITIGTAKDRNREGAAIGGILSFVVQSAGAGMLIGGLAGKRTVLRRVGAVPTIHVGPGGGMLRWDF